MSTPQATGRNPSLYPFVGPRYIGEVPGYVYYPYTDAYYVDPKAQQNMAERLGYGPEKPKKPSLVSTVGPLAAAAGAAALGKGIITAPGETIAGIASIPGQISEGVQSIGSALELSGGQAAAPTMGQTLGSLGSTPVATSAVTGAPVDALGNAVSGVEQGVQQTAGTGLGQAATTALGAAGVGLGAYNAFRGVEKKNPLQAGLGGAGVGFGLNTLGLALGPAGWAAALALPTAAAIANKLGDKDRWKTEGNRLKKLQKQGAFVPEGLLAALPTKGRQKSELIREDLGADFIGRDSQGNWVNNKFAQSRDEKDLRPEDIVNYAAFAEKDPQWFAKPLEERLKIAGDALAAGAVQEKRGSIYVNWEKIGNQQPQTVQTKPINTPQAAPTTGNRRR